MARTGASRTTLSAGCVQGATYVGAVVESQNANVAIYWPEDPRAGTKRVTLLLLAEEAGTVWLRERGDWAGAGFDPQLESAFRRRWKAMFPKHAVFGHPGGKHRDAPSLSEIATILPVVERRLRDTFNQLRGAAAVHRTEQENQWLEKLAFAVRGRLDSILGAEVFGAAAAEAEGTDEGAEQWWISL